MAESPSIKVRLPDALLVKVDDYVVRGVCEDRSAAIRFLLVYATEALTAQDISVLGRPLGKRRAARKGGSR